jgi:hypothetical protein
MITSRGLRAQSPTPMRQSNPNGSRPVPSTSRRDRVTSPQVSPPPRDAKSQEEPNQDAHHEDDVPARLRNIRDRSHMRSATVRAVGIDRGDLHQEGHGSDLRMLLFKIATVPRPPEAQEIEAQQTSA